MVSGEECGSGCCVFKAVLPTSSLRTELQVGEEGRVGGTGGAVIA
jgi:hypothetical protein